MPNDELTPNDGTLSELSDEELDEVAGGFSLLKISAARFNRRTFSTGRRNRRRSEDSELEDTESIALQITIVDGSAEELKIIRDLLGGADAIDDD